MKYEGELRRMAGTPLVTAHRAPAMGRSDTIGVGSPAANGSALCTWKYSEIAGYTNELHNQSERY
jgi:hypothetical protein